MKYGNTILVVTEDAGTRSEYETLSRRLGYSVEVLENGQTAPALLDQKPETISLVLMDFDTRRDDGFEILREIRSAGRTRPVILLSHAPATTDVVRAMKLGAANFLAKPVNPEELRQAIRAALQDDKLETDSNAPEIAFNESWMGKERQAAWRRVAASEVPLLIEGETGAGKEVLARQIHAHSRRAAGPFLKLNCAALPSELVESELFGYERGAFTGAFTSKPGKFEMAQEGTILLDEIGDMDVRLQAKLLHVLQDGECERLGGKERVALDVRVMAATHCNLLKAIEDGRFRADLYYRLNVVSFRVPALRERPADIHAAAEFFLRKHGGDDSAVALLSPALQEAMLDYHWPGNMRELENMMRRLLVMQDPDDLVRQLGARLASLAPVEGAMTGTRGVIPIHPSAAATGKGAAILEEVDALKRRAETEAILRALDATNWNRKLAAKSLRIDYKALLYKMRKLDIEPANGRRSAAGVA